ncbi:MAG: META domain-containing protein [Candidatus Kapabacteria bacterium]|nr:META domain-containing protein [Candidatus Kapabacteria bacterium]
MKDRTLRNTKVQTMFFLAVVSMAVLGGCVSTPVLTETAWAFVSVGGQPVGKGDFSTQQPMFRFLPDSSQIMGYSGCNQFSGSYTQVKNVVKIGPLISTKRACPSMDTESKIYSAFERTTTVKRDDEVLRFYSGDTIVMECKTYPIPTKD